MGLGYGFAAIQLIGFLGVFKEKARLFRRYVFLNWIILYAGLSVAATFIAISAVRHDAAVDACEQNFFGSDIPGSTTEDTKGEQICNIFCWSTLGVMGALCLLLFIVQVAYFWHVWCHSLLTDDPVLFRSRSSQLRCHAESGSYKVPLYLLCPRREGRHYAE